MLLVRGLPRIGISGKNEVTKLASPQLTERSGKAHVSTLWGSRRLGRLEKARCSRNAQTWKLDFGNGVEPATPRQKKTNSAADGRATRSNVERYASKDRPGDAALPAAAQRIYEQLRPKATVHGEEVGRDGSSWTMGGAAGRQPARRRHTDAATAALERAHWKPPLRQSPPTREEPTQKLRAEALPLRLPLKGCLQRDRRVSACQGREGRHGQKYVLMRMSAWPCPAVRRTRGIRGKPRVA